MNCTSARVSLVTLLLLWFVFPACRKLPSWSLGLDPHLCFIQVSSFGRSLTRSSRLSNSVVEYLESVLNQPYTCCASHEPRDTTAMSQVKFKQTVTDTINGAIPNNGFAQGAASFAQGALPPGAAGFVQGAANFAQGSLGSGQYDSRGHHDES